MARYCCAPALSQDTLKVLASATSKTEVIRYFLDQDRFPWLLARRRPGEAERSAAIDLTVRLMTEPRVATQERKNAAYRQERAVRDALDKVGIGFKSKADVLDALRARPGYNKSKGLMPHNWSHALDPSEHSVETLIDGRKADVPVVLPTGMLMPIECKVSNSEVNSIKRLLRETGGKNGAWRSTFGNRLITAAVLDGVYKLENLKSAQDEGMLLFFEHEIDQSIADFAAAGWQPR